MVLKLRIQTLSSNHPTDICLYRAPMELFFLQILQISISGNLFWRRPKADLTYCEESWETTDCPRLHPVIAAVSWDEAVQAEPKHEDR